MTKDKALRLALEALKTIDDAMPFPVAKLAIKECTAALEAKDEPWEQFYPDMGKPQFTPPQRTWVGLTLDDIPDDDTNNLDFYRGGRWAERILKEKNYD